MQAAENLGPYSSARLVPLGEIRSDLLRLALAGWEEKRAERRFPSRPEMTPRHMKTYLRNITLWRRSAEGRDYEYRVMGDADAQAYNRSMVGLHVSDLDKLRPGNGARVKAVLDYMVRKQIPVVSAGWLITSGQKPVYHEMLFLPLGPDEASVDHILGVSVHGSKAMAEP